VIEARWTVILDLKVMLSMAKCLNSVRYFGVSGFLLFCSPAYSPRV